MKVVDITTADPRVYSQYNLCYPLDKNCGSREKMSVVTTVFDRLGAEHHLNVLNVPRRTL